MKKIERGKEYTMKLERLVEFERGHDCINFECVCGKADCKPDSDGSHGRHGLQIRWLVRGAKGAVQFLLYTLWLPLYVKKNSIGYRELPHDKLHPPSPADLGYHALAPHYEGQETMGPCRYCGGQPCYYSGSGLIANDAFYVLVNGGGDELWKFLEAYYVHVFEDGAYPPVYEYPFNPREPTDANP